MAIIVSFLHEIIMVYFIYYPLVMVDVVNKFCSL